MKVGVGVVLVPLLITFSDDTAVTSVPLTLHTLSPASAIAGLKIDSPLGRQVIYSEQ